jgi:capsular polysaccharide biosynthesis protein
MKLIVSEVVDVRSLAFTERNQFLENHPQVPSISQARHLKNTFMKSEGKEIESRISLLAHASLHQDGQNSILIESGRVDDVNSIGHVVCCDPLKKIRQMRSKNPKVFQLNGVVVTTHPGSYNYHHFVFELLPAIWLHRKFLSGKQIVISTSGDSGFVQELIDLLGLNLTVIQVPLNNICHLEDSYVLDFFPFRVYPLELINQIRRKILSSIEINQIFEFGKKDNSTIYLGRGDRTRNRRQIINEEELMNYLRIRFGDLNVIRPGLSNTKENISRLVSAKHIIGPTGGALANLIWVKNLELVTEIIPESYPGDTESFELAQLLGFKYEKLFSQSVQKHAYFSNEDQMVFIPTEVYPTNTT